MKLDREAVASIAVGHRAMFRGHKTRPVRSGHGELVAYKCDGIHGDCDWYLRLDKPEPWPFDA